MADQQTKNIHIKLRKQITGASPKILIVNPSKYKLEGKSGHCPCSLLNEIQRITFRLEGKEIYVEKISPVIVFSNDPLIICSLQF